jgi:hypothetical protein
MHSTVDRTAVNGLSPVDENSDKSLTGGGARIGGSLSQSAHSVTGQQPLKGQTQQQQQQVFSSGFSDLSVNSLPDMSLLRHQPSERPRSKSHQHDSPPRVLTAKSPALQLSQATIQVRIATWIFFLHCQVLSWEAAEIKHNMTS